MPLGANVVQITSSGVFLFGGLAILRFLLFSTKNVSSIRIFARGNPGAVRTALKMYAFLRTKYLRISNISVHSSHYASLTPAAAVAVVTGRS